MPNGGNYSADHAAQPGKTAGNGCVDASFLRSRQLFFAVQNASHRACDIIHFLHAIDPRYDAASFVDRQDRFCLDPILNHASADGILVVVRATDGSQSAGDSRTILLRGHWNPIKQDHMLVHLGAWGFHEKLSRAAGTATRNAAIGGRFNEALRISTGPLLGATDGIGYGLEMGGYAGPLWMMGEWGQRRVHLVDAADFETSAWSVSAGYFLSGEHLPYLARTGNLTSLKVLHPVVESGSRAIELTARYESLAFRNIPQGGRGNAATLGVNWYLTRLVRLMFNAIHWETDRITLSRARQRRYDYGARISLILKVDCANARYSSDNQRDTSIEDQFRIGRLPAEKQGWQVLGNIAIMRFRRHSPLEARISKN